MPDRLFLRSVQPVPLKCVFVAAKLPATAATIAGEFDKPLFFIEHAARRHHLLAIAGAVNQVAALILPRYIFHRGMAHRLTQCGGQQSSFWHD